MKLLLIVNDIELFLIIGQSIYYAKVMTEKENRKQCFCTNLPMVLMKAGLDTINEESEKVTLQAYLPLVKYVTYSSTNNDL